MKVLTLTVGPSGSGKTTWAEAFCRNRKDTVNLNRDEIRKDIFKLEKDSDYEFSKQNEERVTIVQQSMAVNAAICNMNIIVSDTNLRGIHWIWWDNFAEKEGYKIEFKYFIEPLRVLLDRNRWRDCPRPEWVVKKQFDTFMEYFSEHVDFEFPETYKPNCMPPAYVFDIDGTLAKMEGRSPFDWTRVDEDSVIEHVVEVSRALKAAGYAIVIMSGRDGICRLDTFRWLERNGIPCDHLVMRTPKDNRKDSIVKEELFDDFVGKRWNVKAVFDDRNQVVEMWRAKGIPCYQVAEGNF